VPDPIPAELVPWQDSEGELSVREGDVVLRNGALATVASIAQHEGFGGSAYVRVRYTGSEWEDERPAADLVALRRWGPDCPDCESGKASDA
jgi:hypothetical protein